MRVPINLAVSSKLLKFADLNGGDTTNDIELIFNKNEKSIQYYSELSLILFY